MKLVTVLAAVLFLSGSIASAQWTDPIPLPSDSATDSQPVSIGVADSNLVAAWFSRLPSGAAIGMDPALQRVWIPWYNGSYPVDSDTWGVYAAYGDSGGLFPGVKLFADTGVFDMAMGCNGALRTGILYSKSEGVGIDMHSSVFYRHRDGDTWTTAELIAAGSGGPTVIDCTQPCLAGDTGDVFYMSYTRVVHAQPFTYRVYVRRYPGTTIIGEFNGRNPALVHDWHGRLVLACVDDSLGCLVARMYDGTWSDPVILDTTPLAGNPPSLCIDTLGYFWIAYASGTAPNSRLYARYFDRTTWSGPEPVSNQGCPQSPCVTKTWCNRIWVLWQTDTGIFSAFRTDPPGIETRTEPVRSDVILRVSPTISGSRFVVSLARVCAGNHTVRVHNAAGQLVRSLLASSTRRGASSVTWDGTDAGGSRLPNGVYHVRLNGSNPQPMARIVLLR